MAMACDLVIDTGDGQQRVRVVHGNQDDPFNRFVDLRAPLDTPLGHHVVREILPRIDPGAEPGALLEDINWLNDTEQIAQFVGSRLLYRKIIGRLWLIAIPFAAAVAAAPRRLPARHRRRDAPRRDAAGCSASASPPCSSPSSPPPPRSARCCASAGRSPRPGREGGGPVGHNATARERAAHLVADGLRRADHRAHPHPRAVRRR